MATGNIETDKKTTPAEKKPASPDTLVEGGKAELSEDELKGVSGGTNELVSRTDGRFTGGGGIQGESQD